MHKKVYKLSDIGKILTYAPPIFLLLTFALSMSLLWGIMEYRQNSQIALHKQKQKLIQQEYLSKYISSVDAQVQKVLKDVENRLKISANSIKGITLGLEDRIDKAKLKPYIEMLKRKNKLHVLVFDSKFNIWYGEEIAKNISKLIFGPASDRENLKITLMYMISQGDGAVMQWEDNQNRRIQLSYFVHNEYKGLYVGVFSLVDRFRNLTTAAYINAIASAIYNPDGYYFWLYDGDREKVYNIDNFMLWKGKEHIPKDALLLPLNKYNISIGISPARNSTQTVEDPIVDKIKKEFRNKRKNISIFIIAVTAILLLFSAFFSKFIKTIFSNYSRREQRKNEQIANLKERYELAVIASNDGLWDTNFKANRTFFSQKWLDMLGYKKGDMRSYQDWIDIIHPDDRSRVLNEIREHTTVKKDDHLICEYRLQKKDGEYIWVLGRGKVFVDNEGSPLRLSMMSMDIDEKKEADKKMQELVAKEVAKNEKKRRMLIQQNKMAAMGEMIGAIAHQWRQPLNNISLILHFIRDNAKDPDFVNKKMDEFVDRAKTQIEYMSHTIDDFRNFYQPSKESALFSVNDAIETTLAIMSTQIERNDIDVSLSGENLMVHGHENEFKQALLNILSNAKDAIVSKKEEKGKFQGKIDITIKGDIIRIYNNGGFASDEVIERMFEPYFTTKFEDKGTGIGLYMTKMIIENSMNGEISASNRKDGVEFIIKGLK